MQFAYPSVSRTEIYVSDMGNVCIKHLLFPDEDQLIVLNPHQARWLLDKLPILIQEAETIFDETVRKERSCDEAHS
jgi:hypothetical protein